MVQGVITRQGRDGWLERGMLGGICGRRFITHEHTNCMTNKWDIRLFLYASYEKDFTYTNFTVQ